MQLEVTVPNWKHTQTRKQLTKKVHADLEILTSNIFSYSSNKVVIMACALLAALAAARSCAELSPLTSNSSSSSHSPASRGRKSKGAMQAATAD